MHTYHATAHTLFQKLDKEAVLLNLHSEQYFSLDPVGTRIWQVLTETHELEKTVQILLGEYEVDAARLRQDVLALAGRLTAKGLLVAEPSSTDNPRA